MATRVYPTTKPTPAFIEGKQRGTWALQSYFGSPAQPVQQNFLGAISKATGGTAANRTAATNQQGNYDFHMFRWLFGPLSAGGTASGTFDFCFERQANWINGSGGPTADSVVRWKVHIYVTVGASTTVRTVLLDNLVDSVDWPQSAVYAGLASAAALTAGDYQTGDYIAIELGARIVSSPTPTPVYDPPDDSFYTELVVGNIGVVQAGTFAEWPDAVPGNTSNNLAAWFEFSHNFPAVTVSSANGNDSCANAIVIPSFPYTSIDIDTSNAPTTEKEGWWTFTAPSTGKVCLHTFKSNYATVIAAFTGNCAALVGHSGIQRNNYANNRATSMLAIDVVQGTQYFIRVRALGDTNSAGRSGGYLRLSGFYVDTTPQEDDVYYPAGNLIQTRDGQIVNIQPDFYSSSPSGIAIDYTEREIEDWGNGGTNSNHRLLLALHNFELVEILDLPTLNLGESELDFIGDPWFVSDRDIHPAQSFISGEGILYQAWYGNGYLFIAGRGSLPSILNTVSELPAFSALKIIDATHGDHQPDAPFSDALQFPDVGTTAPWAISLHEGSSVLYYVAGPFYQPDGSVTQVIKRWNVNTQVQLPDFATIPLRNIESPYPGLKGLRLLPLGGLLICNSDVVHRLNSSGVIIQTYEPSLSEYSLSLVDLVLKASGNEFVVVDLYTGQFFEFNLADGTEIRTYNNYQLSGSTTQIQIYQPIPPNPINPLSGIYVIERGKRNDTLYTSLDPETTQDVKIPDPFIRTGPLGS